MKTLFLVEDDYYIQQALSRALGSEYHLVIFGTFLEAKQHMTSACDLWLVDISLPDGNGIDLCRSIREKSATPILFLTANQLETCIVEALEAGGDDYVSKPFGMLELKARIHALLRRQKSHSQILCSKDITINLKKHTVYKEREEINLTKTAYTLLVLLVENEGIVLTRKQLFDFLEQDTDHYINDNTLSVHLKRLREQIGTYQGQDYIETIRGVGYRWKDSSF